MRAWFNKGPNGRTDFRPTAVLTRAPRSGFIDEPHQIQYFACRGLNCSEALHPCAPFNVIAACTILEELQAHGVHGLACMSISIKTQNAHLSVRISAHRHQSYRPGSMLGNWDPKRGHAMHCHHEKVCSTFT
jgi:hypothetical protein